MTTEQATEAITRAIEVIADNAAERFTAGYSFESALAGAIAEFSERWPVLGAEASRMLVGA